MLKKVFINMMFGEPFPWYDQYVEACTRLAPYGWHWMIFTPCDVKGSENVHVVKMDLREFDQRVWNITGVDPKNFIDGNGPHKLTSDYYPLYGPIVADYIKGYDFWGHTNWDILYGRLDHYATDEWLEQCDIWTDDPVETNGIFTLYRNTPKVNKLWQLLPEWPKWFSDHTLFYVDEIHFTKVVADLEARGKLRVGRPKDYIFHAYDRLSPHADKPMLEHKEDGTLYELYEDTRLHTLIGREIMMYHFSMRKEWPL